MEEHDINSLDEINSQHIRAFLGEMAARTDTSSHQSGHADRVTNYSNAKTYERSKDRESDANVDNPMTINTILKSDLSDTTITRMTLFPNTPGKVFAVNEL